MTARGPRAATRRTVKAKPRAKRPAQRPGPPRPGPLEASHSGQLFRSRAEARWAIFFDLLGWDWDYEPCHYKLGTLNYLPDFYLPATGTWIEVKGASFLDAAAMGKIASAAAGPHPIPTRQAPYGPAGAVVLVGPLDSASGRPVHQLVTRVRAGEAGLTRAVWEVDQVLTTLDTKPWMTIPATGAKVTRRPSAQRAGAILTPPPTGAVGMDRRLGRAYDLAATLRFDDRTGALSASNPAAVLRELDTRRRGRPLGCAA